jgi:alpha-L-arabinofuranosidase
LFIIAVNKHFTDAMRTTIRLQDFVPRSTATLRVLTGPSLDANNGPELPRISGLKWPRQAKAPSGSMFDQGRPGNVAIQTSALDGVSQSFELVIPSKAVVALELDRR